MHDLHRLKKMLCRELAKYGRESELSLSSLEMVDTLAHACKNVCKIIECYDEDDHEDGEMGVANDVKREMRRLMDMMESM